MGTSNAKHSSSKDSLISFRRRSKSTMTKPPLPSANESDGVFNFAGGASALETDLLSASALGQQASASKCRKTSDQTYQQTNPLDVGKLAQTGSGGNLAKRNSVNSGLSTQVSSTVNVQALVPGTQRITPETQTSPDQDLEELEHLKCKRDC